MLVILDKLSNDDLAAYQAIEARRVALEVNPRAFDAGKSISIFLDWFRFLQKIAEKYDVDETELWKVAATDGTIYYGPEQ